MKHQSRPDSPADHHSAGENLGTRKQAHIDICTDPALPVEGGRSMFDQVRFLHRSLPELDAGSLDSSSEFLGYRLSAPILISCMTGGSDEGYRLNRILAEAAGKLGFAVGTGSLRILLRKPEVTDHFRLKDLAPDVPVLGNIGAVQLPELFAEGAGELDRFLKILQDLSLDALVVHLNPGQELFQTHGDRDFSGLLDYIRLLAERSPLPIIAKETGAGIGPSEAQALFRAGVRYVDIAGAGGTNWMSVEAIRETPDRLEGELGEFGEWGLPSAVALAAAARRCAGVMPPDGGIIASGGLRGPVDFAKSIALGAGLAGAALPFIRAAREGGLEGALAYGESLLRGFRRVMLLSASADIPALASAPLMRSSEFLHSLEELLRAAEEPRGILTREPSPAAGASSRPAENVLEDRKFRKYGIHRRRELLAADPSLNLDAEDFAASGQEAELLDLADVMVETAIGFMPVPMGLARNFIIDGQTVHMPMSVEEPSVIAAATYAASIIGRNGGFTTRADEPLTSSYVYLGYPDGREPDEAARDEICRNIVAAEDRVLETLSEILGPMTRRGGGYRGLEASWLQESRCIRVELIVDVRDAMGANLVNTAAEAISPLMEKLSGGTKLMAILSNQAEKRCASAEFALPFGALQRGSYKGRELAERIVRLWQIADEDPARAVTHNKGIMNGISSLALATANDTRATEAAAHAWAARDGHYRSLSKFWIEGENLRGRLELPLALGTVGGGISFHPVARTALRILGNPSASELSRYAAALGLAQNFSAVSALAGEGIQQGHMRLHSNRLAFSAGARGDEIAKLSAALQESGAYNAEQAAKLLTEIRDGKESNRRSGS
jgi:hydroxymethylglutaryl-CoA reductase